MSMKAAPENRMFFLDNMRSFVVLGVVMLHSGCAYLKLNPWWPVADTSNPVVGAITLFLDVFVMPLLFFIAGYFALPSIQGKKTFSFLSGKLKRLGIPWIICLVSVIPAYFFIYHYTRNNLTAPMSYGDTWLTLMKNFSAFSTMLIDARNRTQFHQSYHMHQSYLWFLSLLLVFFLFFTLVYKMKQDWFDREHLPVAPANTSVFSTLKFLFIVGFLSNLYSVIAVRVMMAATETTDAEAWITLGNILIFQPSRLFIYIIYFSLGIMAFKKKWFERGAFFNRISTWMTAFVLLLACYFYVSGKLMSYVAIQAPSEVIKKTWLAFSLVRNLLAASILGVIASLAIRFWNRPSKFNQSLSANSYNIYLTHLIFVLLFQLMLFTVPGMPAVFKFALVSALSILCAYLVSQFLIKPFPRTTVAAMFLTLLLIFRANP